MDCSGNPDQDIVNHRPEISSMPPPSPPLAATTYLIAAERALRHLENNLPQINEIFSAFQIPRSDYGVYAGFNQELGFGFLEKIQVFIRSEVNDMPSLLSQLGSILVPFPAFLYTETSVYEIFAADKEHVDPLSRYFGAFGLECYCRPMAICLTRASASNSLKGFGSGTESNRQNRGSREELLEDEPSIGINNDVGRDPSGPLESQASWNAEITWYVASEICSSLPGETRVVSQRLCNKGKVMIERTPEVAEPKHFATCKVQFTDLESQTHQLDDKMKYRQYHTIVNINSLQENADIPFFEPTFKHHPAFTTSPVQTRETTTGTEKSANIYRITQKERLGAIEWGYDFADTFETNGGMPLDQLPRADFTFVGDDDDTPAPPPQTLNIEVRTYWSWFPHSDSKSWSLLYLGNKPSYSNLCQMTVLNVPADLQKDHEYRATVHVYPQSAAKENPIKVWIGIEHTSQEFDGDETGEWTGSSVLSENRQSNEVVQPGEYAWPFGWISGVFHGLWRILYGAWRWRVFTGA